MLEMFSELSSLFRDLMVLLGNTSPESLVKAVMVFVSIIGLRLVKVIPNGKWARATNVVLSVLLSGITASSISPDDVAIMTMTSAFAAALWEVSEKIYNFVKERIKSYSK